MRLNERAFEKSLKTDGSLTNFWKYTSGSVSYDATTQVPTYSGTLVQAFSDVLDFKINEITNAGGIINLDSKKFVVLNETELEKGDEVLDDSYVEVYKIVAVFKFANRRHLYANKVHDNNTTH